jgi:hypothetical protein
MANPRFYLDKYFPQLLQRIEENLKVNKELEIRFTELGNIKKKYDEYIPLEPDTFKRVKDYFTQKYGTPKEIHSEDRIKNGKRQSIVINEDGSEEILAIEKASLWDSKTEDYNLGYRNINSYDEFGIKISLAKEVDIKPETKKFVDPDVQRTKHRYSWKDGFLQYDITRVIQEEKGKKSKTMYEMEIEVIQSLFQARTTPYTKEEKEALFTIFMRLDNRMRFLWTIMNDSDVMFKRSELDDVENMIQEYTNSGEYRKDAFVVKARNLKFYDLVNGGLVGGKVEYTVTPKAEGLRKFLVIDGRGVWLIYPGDQYCLVERSPSDPEKYKSWRWFNYRNTILDGEDILPERRKEGGYQTIKHFYLPFDTLIFKGEDVRKLSLLERQKFTNEIRNAIGSSSNLIIKQKPFIPLGKSMKTFFSEVNSMFETMEGLDYNTDGLIFTPINSPYNSHSDKLKDKRKRNLVENPDICKWKPANEYTIDLKVIRTPSNRGLFASNGKFPDELFKGNQNAPFDPEIQVDWYHPMFADIYNNAIVEFGPKLNSDGKQVKAENDGIILIPIRIREDKQYANSIFVTQDTWNDLNNPIQEDTIRGKSLQLVRKYHNVVKRNLFDSAIGNDNHLIDIGSGYGGDISKTNKYSRILAIEPDAEHMEEFRRRLSLFSPEKQRQISTLIAGGEEYEKIMTAVRHTFGNEFGKKPLYISMMLSMTFFWKSEEMLQQLANTINLIKEEYYRSVPKELKTSSGPKYTVKFLFLVMDGERVIKYLKENDDSVNLNGALINYKDGIVYIDIPGTIVERQTEYPVYLKDLREITDMEVIYEKVSNEEKFLSENELKYTSLYIYGEYSLPNKPIYLFSQENKKDEKKELIFPETEAKNFTEDLDIPLHNTLFFELFKAFNPDIEKNTILPKYVLLYRKEISESIDKINPFDLEGNTIFESAGNGFLKETSENIEYAKNWIFSDNELSPEYISWLPDVIGSNLNINGIVYETSIPTNGFIELDYEPSLNVYTLKV